MLWRWAGWSAGIVLLICLWHGTAAAGFSARRRDAAAGVRIGVGCGRRACRVAAMAGRRPVRSRRGPRRPARPDAALPRHRERHDRNLGWPGPGCRGAGADGSVRGTHRNRGTRAEPAGRDAWSTLGDGSGTITTGQSARRAQARATEPGASRRSHPRRRDPSTSRSPPRAMLASSTAGRPEKACCSMATSPGIQPTAWSMAVRISTLPYATRSAYRSRDVGGMPGPAIAAGAATGGRKTWTSSRRAPRRRASPTAHASAHQLAGERLMPTTRRGTRPVPSFTARLLLEPERRSPC